MVDKQKATPKVNVWRPGGTLQMYFQLPIYVPV